MHLLIHKNQPSSFSVPFVLNLRADVLSLHLSLMFIGCISHWRGVTQAVPASSSVWPAVPAVPATGVTSAFEPSPAYMSDACGRCAVLEMIWSLLESTSSQNMFPEAGPQCDVGKATPPHFISAHTICSVYSFPFNPSGRSWFMLRCWPWLETQNHTITIKTSGDWYNLCVPYIENTRSHDCK